MFPKQCFDRMTISLFWCFFLIYNVYAVLVYYLITKTFSQRARVTNEELLAVLRMTDDDMNPLPSTEKNFGWISEEITMVEDSSKFWGSYICLTILYALCHAGSLF